VRAAATAALGLLLALFAAGFASPSLLVPGVALLLVAIVSVGWVELAALGARLDRKPGPDRIVEGDAYPLELALRRGLVPPPGGELRDALLAEPARVGPLGPRRVATEVRLDRRGRYGLEGTSWVIRDPLGLRERRIEADATGEVLVLPRIHPVRVAGLGGAGAGTGPSQAGEEGAAGVREAQAVEFEIDGLRPYRAGSAASRIHWPAVARSGEMHERRLVAGADALPLVVLDAETPDDPGALDRAVRAAASICVHLASSGGCAVQLPGHRAPAALDSRLRAWPQIHSWLALVQAGTPTAVPSRAGGAGSVLWVSGGSLGRAKRIVRGFGPGPHYLVSPRAAGGGRHAFEVAGCSARVVGADSRRGMGRAA
jgi:uncharacterized protein (DUF58 family)